MDSYEQDVLEAYEKGELVSTVSSETEKDIFRSAARATLVKDRRVNIRLTSSDLLDIQARAWKKVSLIKPS